VQQLQTEMAGLRNRIDFNQQRAQELGELIDRYESDIAAAEKKQTEQESQIQEADALIARINQLLKTKENEVEQHVEIWKMRARLECKLRMNSDSTAVAFQTRKSDRNISE
jgi:chromosome segregation ATPase